MPASFLSQNSLLNAGSVAASWVTAYCRWFSWATASGSFRYSSVIATFLDLSQVQFHTESPVPFGPVGARLPDRPGTGSRLSDPGPDLDGRVPVPPVVPVDRPSAREGARRAFVPHRVQRRRPTSHSGGLR